MKKVILVLAIVFCCQQTFAQDEQSEGFQKSKVFGGGSLGLTFGSYTLINLSPQIGYRFNKYFASGIGVNLQYASFKQRDAYGNDFSKIVQGVTGLNVFGRFYLAQKFLIQLQPEANYIFGKQIFYQPTEETYKINAEIIPSMLAGGGIVMPAGRGVFITTVMYDLLQRENSPYGNRPIVNFGYNVNF